MKVALPKKPVKAKAVKPPKGSYLSPAKLCTSEFLGSVDSFTTNVHEPASPATIDLRHAYNRVRKHWKAIHCCKGKMGLTDRVREAGQKQLN